MKSIVYEGPNNVQMRIIPQPNVEEGYVLIETAYAGICGTDLNIFSGSHPRAQAPLVLGHEVSGTLVTEHPDYPIGTHVTINPLLACGECGACRAGNGHVCETLQLIGIDMDGGMAEIVKVPNHCVVPLPSNVPLKRGALSEPMAVAVHAARQGGYKPGDSVALFGAGTIGLCLAFTLRQFGCMNLTIIETNESRVAKAAQFGFHTLNPAKDDIENESRQLTNGAGFDFVFDCAGHPAVLPFITDIVRVKGSIVIVAAYKKPAELNLLSGMFKELSIQFVRVYTPEDFSIALGLLGRTDEVEQIITNVYPPEEAAVGFEELTGPTDAIKVLYEFNQR